MLEIHTGFCGKVISISGNLATIQPLNMIKAPGGQPQKQAVEPAPEIVRPQMAAAPVQSGRPRWQSASADADILDPFVTLHSPSADAQPQTEPFRTAANEAQLDVEPEMPETNLHAEQNHMAAWDPAPEMPPEQPVHAP